jgi:hypothetical protein
MARFPDVDRFAELEDLLGTMREESIRFDLQQSKLI